MERESKGDGHEAGEASGLVQPEFHLRSVTYRHLDSLKRRAPTLFISFPRLSVVRQCDQRPRRPATLVGLLPALSAHHRSSGLSSEYKQRRALSARSGHLSPPREPSTPGDHNEARWANRVVVEQQKMRLHSTASYMYECTNTGNVRDVDECMHTAPYD